MSRQAMEAGCLRILIVGNFILRRGIASIVSGLAARASIAEASSFHDGKARLRSEEFSAAIFDVDRGDQNGPIDFQLLRADHPQLILAVLSRADNAGAILRYLAAGVNGYILELSSQSEIEQAIGAVLKRVLYIPPHVIGPNIGRTEHDPAVTAVCRNFRGLTDRQTAVLRLVLRGCSNKEIARALDLSPHTVKIHVGALLRHFSVQKRSDLLIAASRNHDGLATCAAAKRYDAPRPPPMPSSPSGASMTVGI
jgi:DNA-binding NarL/FixJ family response regulator